MFMRLHRFIADIDLTKKTLDLTDEDLVNQIRNVLRLRVGDKLILSDGRLNEAEVVIADAGKNMFRVEVESKYANENEPRSQGILYCSILKRENFELVVQKATEVGIKEIQPIISERTVKLNLRMDRLQKIIKEAAEQSGRGMLPILHNPLDFEKAFEPAKKNDINLFFDAPGKRLESGELKDKSRVGAWIGPEGGWTAEELALAEKEGFRITSLGKTVLRAETAAIVASHVIAQQ